MISPAVQGSKGPFYCPRLSGEVKSEGGHLKKSDGFCAKLYILAVVKLFTWTVTESEV